MPGWGGLHGVEGEDEGADAVMDDEEGMVGDGEGVSVVSERDVGL